MSINSQQERETIIGQFSEHYDGELSEAQRAHFEAYLEAHSDVAEEYEAFRGSLDMVHMLRRPEDTHQAPNDFLREVTTDINRQSRGRFFNDTWIAGYRVPFEVFAAIMLAIMASLYFVAMPDRATQFDAVDEGATTQGDGVDPDESFGAGMGHESPIITWSLEAPVALVELSATLKEGGFGVRPEVSEHGDALLVTVPIAQLTHFEEQVQALTGHAVALPQEAADEVAYVRVLTIRLVVQ